MEKQNATSRRFEVTKLEERLAPTSFNFGGFSGSYNVSGGTVSGSITLPGGHTYAGSISESALLADLKSLFSHL